MVDFAADQATGSICCVEAVAFGKEMFEGAGRWWLRWRDWAIFDGELRRRRAAMFTNTGVFEPVTAFLDLHGGAEIGQVEPTAGNLYRDCVGSVETEKPHAGFAIASHVGARV